MVVEKKLLYNWPFFSVITDIITRMMQDNSLVDILGQSNSISGTMFCSVV